MFLQILCFFSILRNNKSKKQTGNKHSCLDSNINICKQLQHLFVFSKSVRKQTYSDQQHSFSRTPHLEHWNSFRRFILQQHAELTSNQKFHHGKWHFVIVNCPCSPTITHCCDSQSFVSDEQCCKPYRPFKLLVFKIAKMILIVFMKNPQKIPNPNMKTISIRYLCFM